MTNDLNTIPASVRVRLVQIASGDYKACGVFAEDLARDALPLIERLCQPNIVIVDLDDEKLVERVARALILEDSPNNNEMDIARNMEFYIPVAKAALAALKEKV